MDHYDSKVKDVMAGYCQSIISTVGLWKEYWASDIGNLKTFSLKTCFIWVSLSSEGWNSLQSIAGKSNYNVLNTL